MSDLKALKILKSLLVHRDKWTLDCIVPDGFAEVGQKAESIAAQSLSKISLLFLWRRYNKWVKSDPQIRNSDDYFHAFISQVAFDIAVDGLQGDEKIKFFDEGYFNFKFI
jgi:hypothetical protein